MKFFNKTWLLVKAVVTFIAIAESIESTRFTDLKVVCLGCSTGIGRSTAEYLASEGAKVVACSRSASFEWIATGNFTDSIHPTKCDASSVESINDLLTFSVNTLGGITGLVYIPTYMGKYTDRNTNRPLQTLDLDYTLSYAEKQFNIDYKGFIAAVHIFLQELRKTGRGSVVAISSIASEIMMMGSFNQNLHYGAVKSAQNYAVRNLAKTYAHVPIRFNTVSPGATYTPIYDSFGEEAKQAFFEDIALRTPMMRHAESVEIAKSISFLLSSEASYITGIDLKVDGGWTLMDGTAGSTLGNSAEEMESEWMRLTTNPEFDLESRSIRKKESECEQE